MSAARRRLAPAVAAGLLIAATGASAQADEPAAASRTVSAQLSSVAALSKGYAWAVGSLIEHWNGRKWSVVPGAKAGRCPVYLYRVAARSTSLAWAVGYCGNARSQRPVIERWNGHRWSVQPSPSIPAGAISALSGITATSASNAWAVGAYVSKHRLIPLIEHWNGRVWKVQAIPNPSPSGAELGGVAALSSTSAWAVGTTLISGFAKTKSLIEHWNGHGWHIQPSISPGSENALASVSALRPAQVWAAGFYTFGQNLGTLVEFWNGVSWAEPSTPGPDLQDVLADVAARTATEVWTVGTRDFLEHPRTLIQHWNGTTWKVVPSPSPSTSQNGLQGVAVVSGSYAWAVGYQGRYKTLIERWNGTAWKVVPSPN